MAQSILVVFGVLIIVFLMLHLVPGDPAQVLFGDAPVPKEQVEAVRHALGLDLPLHVQLERYVRRTLAGDLGRSLKTNRPVAGALARAIPFIYFSCGTMPHWEADIYAQNLPADQWNARWWKYVSDMQGVEPPSPRGEEWCDAATKTHINDTPAYYYNYAFATVFKFQIHDYIARKILHQPPQSCNYADNKEVGTWLNNILKKGSTEDWRKVLKEATGEDISTRAMADYFKPLQSWLEEQNKGRQIGWE